MAQAALLSLFLVGALPVWAGAVAISVDTPGFIYGGLTVDSNDALAVAWSQPATVFNSGVDISINFQSLSGPTSVYTAYLMTAIGPQVDQTFFSDLVATRSFTASADQPGWVQVFSDLALGPSAAYYLLIGTSDPGASGGWSVSADPAVVTTDFGITRGDGSGVQFWSSAMADPNANGSLNAAYLPASNFSPLSADEALGTGELLFQVTVPEPATLWLIGAGLLGLGLLRRRNRA